MDLHLEGKLALVSGSTKGIGLAIATGLAREGARVIVNGRKQASVDEALEKLRAQVPSANVEGFAGDLSDASQIDLLVAKYPAVDILVNNLGIFDVKPFEEVPDDEWSRFFDTNVMSGVQAHARLSGEDESEELGSRGVHQQRERRPDSRGNDSLRCDEDGATGVVAWARRALRRHGRHGERGITGSDAFRRSRRNGREGHGRQIVRRVREGLL
jgi:NAD(P)-dependent dehydrogenase (short-subunit alcohol dehydrogenase family)